MLLVGTPNPPTVAFFAAAVGPSGKVTVIEPDAASLSRIEDRLREENHQHVTLICKAASDHSGCEEFLVAERTADSRLACDEVLHYNDLRGYRATCTVEVDQVDSIMQEVGVTRLDHVEVSVNGMEMHVLRGMQRILHNTSRAFVIGRGRCADTGEPLNVPIARFLEDHGFRTHIVRDARCLSREGWGEVDGDVLAFRRRYRC